MHLSKNILILALTIAITMNVYFLVHQSDIPLASYAQRAPTDP